MTGETNAVKAQVIAWITALIGLLIAFGVPLTDVQEGAILTFVGATGSIYVGLTYTKSHKRRA